MLKLFLLSLKQVHPGDLKSGVEALLNGLLEPVRKEFEDPDNVKLVAEAYPSAAKKKK